MGLPVHGLRFRKLACSQKPSAHVARRAGCTGGTPPPASKHWRQLRQPGDSAGSPLCCRNFELQCLGRIQRNCHEETDCRGGTRRVFDLVRSTGAGARWKRCAGRAIGSDCFWTGGRGRRCVGRIYRRTRDRSFLGSWAARPAIPGSANSAIRSGNETNNCRQGKPAAGCQTSAACSRTGCQHKDRPAGCDEFGSFAASCKGSRNDCQHKARAADSDL